MKHGGLIERLAKDTDGGATSDFLIAFPVFLLFMTAIIEFGILIFVNALFEKAALEASRFGAIGLTVAGQTREERIIEIVNDTTLGLVDTNEMTITTLVYPSFSSIGTAEPFTDTNGNGDYDSAEPFTDINGNGQWDADIGLAGTGGANDIVLYRLEYEWRSMTGLLAPVFENFAQSVTVAVRNEPF